MKTLSAAVVLVVVGLAQTAPVRAQGGRVLEEMACPVPEPMGMEVRGEHLWISDMTTRTVNQVDKSDGSILESFPVPGFQPTGLAWHGDTLFAGDRWIDRIDRRRPGQQTDSSPIPYFEKWAMGMVHDGEHLWVVDGRSARLHQIDPEDGTTIKSFTAPAEKPIGIAFDGTHLWVSDHRTDEIYRVDRDDGRVLTVMAAPGPYPSALAADGDSLWVADYEKQRLYRVALPGETAYVEDKPRELSASFEVLYRAKGQGSVANLTAFLSLPRDIPGQHLHGELQFDPEPTRFETDRWGQRVAVFELGTLPAGEVRRVGWLGRFTLYRVRFQLDPQRVDAARAPDNLTAYLADDKKYDLGSKTVTKLVEELTEEKSSYYWRARAIYEHLTEVIKYDRSSGWNNAATVLERGTGSCSEYTFALVALLRRAGVPARYVGAVSERDGDASFDDVFHRWAEAYMPGYGWVPIDANAGEGKLPGERGHYFGGRSNRHVVTTIGGGASKYLEWDYNHHETWEGKGQVELEAQPISRYRPLEGAVAAEAVTTAPQPEAFAAGEVASSKPRPEQARRPVYRSPLALGLMLLLIGLLGLFVLSRDR